MKRLLILLGFLLAFTAACTKAEVVVNENDGEQSPIPDSLLEEPTKKIHIFNADPSVFHFVSDWLTDTKILYVEKNNSIYQVKFFDIETGESSLVYEDESFITDVIVHPVEDYLLIHTSNQADAALLKVVSLEGAILHEMEIASSELSVNWNASDSQKILITAFHEDWTFDIFVFDGHDENLSIVDVEDPFPKWAGVNQIASINISEHALNGGKLQFLNLETDEISTSEIDNIVYFDTYGERLFIVTVPKDDLFTFSMNSLVGETISEWQMPAVSNYSEWVIPEVVWINEDYMLFKGTEKSGQLDELGSAYNLYAWEGTDYAKLLEGLGPEPLKCSPSGEYCLSGYTSEELIEKASGDRLEWIKFDE